MLAAINFVLLTQWQLLVLQAITNPSATAEGIVEAALHVVVNKAA
jgi:hypothetical protein